MSKKICPNVLLCLSKNLRRKRKREEESLPRGERESEKFQRRKRPESASVVCLTYYVLFQNKRKQEVGAERENEERCSSLPRGRGDVYVFIIYVLEKRRAECSSHHFFARDLMRQPD